MNKRQFFKSTGLLTLASVIGGSRLFASEAYDELPGYTPYNEQPFDGEFTLPALPYSFDALEPHIDARTMEIHHDRHHKAYVDNLNKAIKENASWANMSLEDILKKVKTKDEAAIRNNAGGHWNHSFFWKNLSPQKGQKPGEQALAKITAAFGSWENFKTEFTKAATTRFGSGWAWLCADKNKNLFICSTPNQDNPLMTKIAEKQGTPIIALDVWEHAYYLKYQNKRADYINAYFEIINWNNTSWD